MKKHCRAVPAFPKEWSMTFQEANTDKTQKNVLRRQRNLPKYTEAEHSWYDSSLNY